MDEKVYKELYPETPRTERKLIGLSLSQCIKDIMLGYAKKEEVVLLYTGTRFDPDYPEGVWKSYASNAWQYDPRRALELLRWFIAENKIVQPRALGLEAPNIAGGHWYKLVDRSFYL